MHLYLQLLRRRPQFRLLWASQVISLTGDWFNTIATVILVTRYTDSGVAVGGLFLARALPPFVFGPLAGVVADRFDRRWVLIWCNLVRIPIVLGYLLVQSEQTVWLVYLFSVAQFAASSFFEPAWAAILPRLVQRDELLSANTLGSVTWSTMLSVGALLGGVTTAFVGVEIALLIDAATFGLAAALLWRMQVPAEEGAPPAEGRSSGWLDFLEGLRYVRVNPAVGLIALVKAISHLGSVDIMVTLYSERVFPLGQDGALTLGLLYTAFGLGSVSGPLIANRFGAQTERYLQRAIGAGFLLIPLGWVLYSVAPTLALALVGAVLRGMGGSINWVYSSVLLQLKTPDRFLGACFWPGLYAVHPGALCLGVVFGRGAGCPGDFPA
ncbi:MAG: MFS transporter [Anaerolineae bacterium]|nr:MFS transporter [Anaerolineae bacterium]